MNKRARGLRKPEHPQNTTTMNMSYCRYQNTLIAYKIAKDEAEALEFLDSRYGRHLGDKLEDAETQTMILAIVKEHGTAYMAAYRKAR